MIQVMEKYDINKMADTIILEVVGKLPEEPKPQPIQDNTFYRVILGSYKNKDNSSDMVNKLKSQGIDAFIGIIKNKN